MMNLESLTRLNPDHFSPVLDNMPTSEEALEWFKILHAGWVHSGDPQKPHAVLHSGKHSNGFFLCKKVLKYGNLREILAACIINKLRKVGLGKVDGVFGSPYSSILLAGDVGRLLRVPIYVPEKDPTDPTGKKMIFKPDDPVPEDSVLLQIEELVTTFDSGQATLSAIYGGNFYKVLISPFVGVLVYRPPRIDRVLPDGRIIVSFIEKQIDAWNPPPNCPLCKQGSAAVPPKSNWAYLTA